MLVMFVAMTFATEVDAQSGKPSLGSVFGKGKTNLGGSLGGLSGFGDSSTTPYKWNALYEAEKGSQRGRISLTVTLEPDYSIYSVTQPKGGPLATKIAIVSNDAKLDGPFAPDVDPKVSTDELGFEGVRVEKHFDQVSWTAPISFAKPIVDGAVEGAGPLQISVDGQVCKNACIPIDSEIVEAQFGGYYEVAKPNSADKPFRDPKAKTSWIATLSKSSVQPGETVELVLSSTTDADLHLYAIRPNDKNTNSSTVIVMSKKSSLLAGGPLPSKPVITEELIPGSLSVSYHDPQVAWKILIKVPLESIDGTYPIEGYVGYQACNADVCEEQLGMRFTGELNVNRQNEPSSIRQLAIESVSYASVIGLPARLTWIDQSSTGEANAKPAAVVLSLPALLSKFALALLGGFILNLMTHRHSIVPQMPFKRNSYCPPTVK